MGQDRRWRDRMVADISVETGDRVLDVAAGTGSITRRLAAAGADVVSLDQSYEMLDRAVERGATAIVATAEELPFADDEFDVVTFGYLLRYVDSVPGAMTEITRVVRPGAGSAWSSSDAPADYGASCGGASPESSSPSPAG